MVFAACSLLIQWLLIGNHLDDVGQMFMRNHIRGLPIE
jgi:hypothetical protein